MPTMTMFKRTHRANASAGTGTSWPAPMPADVYERNGIARRPSDDVYQPTARNVHAHAPHAHRINNDAYRYRPGPRHHPPHRSMGPNITNGPYASSYPRAAPSPRVAAADGRGYAAPSATARRAPNRSPPRHPPMPSHHQPTSYSAPQQQQQHPIMSSQHEQLTLHLPPGPLGVNIQKTPNDGTCVVTSKTAADLPLRVGDVIESINGTAMLDVKNGVQGWVRLLAETANDTRIVVVRRRRKAERDREEAPPENTPLSPAGNNNELPATASKSNSGRRLRQSLKSMNPFGRQTSDKSSGKATKESSSAKIMRIYIAPPMQPGQNIRVLCPNDVIMMATIPPRNLWLLDDETKSDAAGAAAGTGAGAGQAAGRRFFRVEFDPSVPGGIPLTAVPRRSSGCTCAPTLGVFDTTCPVHGTSDRSADGGNDHSHSDIPKHSEMDDDLISVAQEEGARTESFAPSDRSSVAHRGLGWSCKSCSLINDLENESCELCGVRRYGGLREDQMQPATLHLT